MKLHCPDCGSQIQASDMNLQTAAAKCGACNAVFNFAGALDADKKRIGPGGNKPAEILARPSRMQIEDFGGELTVRWRWFTPVAFFLLFFCIAWDSFLIFWYSMAVGEDKGMGPMKWIFIIFPIGHVAVGIGLTYFMLALFFNKTVVTAGTGMLKVWTGPLPFGRNHHLPSGDIEQLFCEKKEHRGEDSTSHSYGLFALLRNGKKVKLLGSLENATEAKYLEQLLEQRLRIPNRAVAGEMV